MYSLSEMLEVDKMLQDQEQKRRKIMASKYNLYCDMDGVLCDFKGRFDHYTGLDPREYEDRYGKNEFWKLIDHTIGEVFWSEMNWTPSGKQLWDFIKGYSPSLLTSPSREIVSREGKQKWVDKNLSPTPKVLFKYSKEKQDLATPTSILIDDREDIIKRWIQAGGIGIHHPENTRNISSILKKLKRLGYE